MRKLLIVLLVFIVGITALGNSQKTKAVTSTQFFIPVAYNETTETETFLFLESPTPYFHYNDIDLCFDVIPNNTAVTMELVLYVSIYDTNGYRRTASANSLRWNKGSSASTKNLCVDILETVNESMYDFEGGITYDVSYKVIVTLEGIGWGTGSGQVIEPDETSHLFRGMTAKRPHASFTTAVDAWRTATLNVGMGKIVYNDVGVAAIPQYNPYDMEQVSIKNVTRTERQMVLLHYKVPAPSEHLVQWKIELYDETRGMVVATFLKQDILNAQMLHTSDINRDPATFGEGFLPLIINNPNPFSTPPSLAFNYYRSFDTRLVGDSSWTHQNPFNLTLPEGVYSYAIIGTGANAGLSKQGESLLYVGDALPIYDLIYKSDIIPSGMASFTYVRRSNIISNFMNVHTFEPQGDDLTGVLGTYKVFTDRSYGLPSNPLNIETNPEWIIESGTATTHYGWNFDVFPIIIAKDLTINTGTGAVVDADLATTNLLTYTGLNDTNGKLWVGVIILMFVNLIVLIIKPNGIVLTIVNTVVVFTLFGVGLLPIWFGIVAAFLLILAFLSSTTKVGGSETA